MQKYVRLSILLYLVAFFSAKTYPATNMESCLFKDSVLRTTQYKDLPFLFSQQMKDSTIDNKKESLKLKNSNMAIFYAIIPGIVIHGAGHFYAGKHRTAAILFSSGLIGASSAFMGAFTSYDRNAPTNTGYVLIITGAALFIGSWTYDLFGAPIAVNNQNQILMQRKNTEMKFQLKDSGLRLALVYHF